MNTVFLHEGESRESLFRNKRFMLDEMFQQNKYLEQLWNMKTFVILIALWLDLFSV